MHRHGSTLFRYSTRHPPTSPLCMRLCTRDPGPSHAVSYSDSCCRLPALARLPPPLPPGHVLRPARPRPKRCPCSPCRTGSAQESPGWRVVLHTSAKDPHVSRPARAPKSACLCRPGCARSKGAACCAHARVQRVGQAVHVPIGNRGIRATAGARARSRTGPPPGARHRHRAAGARHKRAPYTVRVLKIRLLVGPRCSIPLVHLCRLQRRRLPRSRPAD